jgi:hypothetical protein
MGTRPRPAAGPTSSVVVSMSPRAAACTGGGAVKRRQQDATVPIWPYMSYHAADMALYTGTYSTPAAAPPVQVGGAKGVGWCSSDPVRAVMLSARPSAPRTKIAQGWPKLQDLAQQLD